MYIFKMSMDVMGLLLITIAWSYGNIELGVGTSVRFSFVCINLGIIASMLAEVGPEYQLCLCLCVVRVVVYDLVVMECLYIYT